MKSCLHLFSLLIAMISPAWSFAQNPSPDTSEVMVFLKGENKHKDHQDPITGELRIINKTQKDTLTLHIDKSRLLRLATSSHYRIDASDESHFSNDVEYTPSKPKDTLTIVLPFLLACGGGWTPDPILFGHNVTTFDPSMEPLYAFPEMAQKIIDSQKMLVMEIYGYRCHDEKKAVSLKRAIALRDYAISQGVPESQIKIFDRGIEDRKQTPKACRKVAFNFIQNQ